MAEQQEKDRGGERTGQSENRTSQRERKASEAVETVFLPQDEDDYFTRAHNPATHGEDPRVARRYGDV